MFSVFVVKARVRVLTNPINAIGGEGVGAENSIFVQYLNFHMFPVKIENLTFLRVFRE